MNNTPLKIEVFQRPPLLLLILLTLLFGLVHGLINKNIREGVWRALSSACMQFKGDPRAIRNPIIVLGYALLIINYFAGFRGQALSMKIIQSPLFRKDHIRQNLTTGKVPLIVTSSTDLGPRARKLLFGDANADLRKFGTIEEPDPLRAAVLLCNRQDVLFFGAIESIRWANRLKNCVLRTLFIPFQDGTFLDITGPLAFALSPAFPRKERKIMDDIILLIFSPAQVQDYWMPKYDVSIDDDDVLLEYASSGLKAITIDHIWPAIILAIVGYSLAISVFVKEYFHLLSFLKPLSVQPLQMESSSNWTSTRQPIRIAMTNVRWLPSGLLRRFHEEPHRIH